MLKLVINLFLILTFVSLLFAGLTPQLRTHYTPRPALQRARQIKIWSYRRPRWAIAVAIVRIA